MNLTTTTRPARLPLAQFDALDFSDNEIKKLGNLPRSPRLSTLLLSNNHVARVDAALSSQAPNLATLVLTHNRLEHLADVEPLGASPRAASRAPIARRRKS